MKTNLQLGLQKVNCSFFIPTWYSGKGYMCHFGFYNPNYEDSFHRSNSWNTSEKYSDENQSQLAMDFAWPEALSLFNPVKIWKWQTFWLISKWQLQKIIWFPPLHHKIQVTFWPHPNFKSNWSRFRMISFRNRKQQRTFFPKKKLCLFTPVPYSPQFTVYASCSNS